MPGLVPGIHNNGNGLPALLDGRVKSGHDGLKLYRKPKTIFPGQPYRKWGE